ncbi:hypothetical protein BELL_1313g00010 [Botrytis elliptica]|uniref:Uncharacterized protein n=1 Tax=Botrytis elliptica TaxID=278938 RepID=A0A4Z1I8V5_9HELO|nr:hypothetical protein EAE99_005313 [Botrytis elliptica]TGO57998.1 hypothetical protein BELL_1313g00010 [Botrytis elliptica]
MPLEMYTVGDFMQHMEYFDKAQAFEGLLRVKEFTSLIVDFYTSFSAESKSIVQELAQELSRKPNQTKNKQAKGRALTTIINVQKVTLPASIQYQYEIWKGDPVQFWRSIHNSGSTQSIEVAAIEAYLIMQDLRLRQEYDTILWRFYVTFFYQLALMIGHGQKMMTNNLHNILYERLGKVFIQSEKIADEVATVQANLHHWVDAGFKYNKICTALDKGALFLIPQVPDHIWENSNSLKGREFDEAMAHLKSIGIMELSKHLGADVLASQILDSVLGPFRWEVYDAADIAASLNTKPKPFSGGPSARGPSAWGSSAADLSIRGSSIKGTSARSTSARGSSIKIQFAGNSSTGGSSAESRPIGASPFIEARPSDSNPISISSMLNPPESAQSYDKIEGSDILVKLEPDKVERDTDSSLKPYNSGLKRKRVDSVTASDSKMGWIPTQSVSGCKFLGFCPVDRNKMESLLGKRLFDGMMKSRKRLRDDNHQLTDAIQVIAPYSNITQDFIYQMWVCSSVGKSISEINIGGSDDLRELLPDIILNGIETSLHKQEEARQKEPGGPHCFKIFPISNNDDDDDYVVEIRLGFTIGKFVMWSLYKP